MSEKLYDVDIDKIRSDYILNGKAKVKRQSQEHFENQIEEAKINEMNRKSEEARKKMLEHETFSYETHRQEEIRNRLTEIGDSIINLENSASYVSDKKERIENLKKEYFDLQQEYTNFPINLGKLDFKLILHYETKNGNQLISKDGGNTWIFYEDVGSGLSKSPRKVIVKDGMPSQIIGSFSNEYTHRFISKNIPTTTEIILHDCDLPKEVLPKPKRELIKLTKFCDVCKEPNSSNSKVCKRCKIPFKN